MTLYINSCVREKSRTDKLARAVLRKLGGQFQELYLPDEDLKPLSRVSLARRTELVEQKAFDEPLFRYAKQFAAADRIVISAPFWDFSFPALLKVYLENIYVIGIVSEYDSSGVPRGLCRAEELYYVTTAGGPFVPDFSFHYLRGLAEQCFGIPRTVLVKAEMLDVDGVDPDKVLSDVISTL